MAKQTINIGTVADDGTGDTLRAGGDKINDNFTELYDADTALDGRVAALEGAPAGGTGDMLAANNLSDVADVPTARTNLDVYSKAEVDSAVAGGGGGGGAATLDDLTDVDLTGAATGDVLTKDAGGDWVAAAPAADGGWEVAASWNYASPVSNVSLTGLSGFSELIILATGITTSTSTYRVIRVSTNGGSSFYSASGDYKTLQASGLPLNAAELAGHSTAQTGGVALRAKISGNIAGAVKTHDNIFGGGYFAASTDVIDAIQLAAVAGNITGGSLFVLGR